MITCLRLIVGLVALLGAQRLHAAAPQITQSIPLALAPGRTTELTLRGQGLLAARSIWTTFANRCEILPSDDDIAQKGEKVVCRITLPREAQLGIGALRLVTAEGVSNPFLLMLDDLPTIVESSDNHSPALAQPLQLPTAVDGQCDPVQEDMYRFQAAAGERLAFEIVAQRLGSKLDPILRVLSLVGEEIIRLDDTEGAAGDIRFAHTFAAAGEYLVALRDVRHAGGSDHRYRLRIGSFPIIKHVYPAGGQSGAVTSFALTGDALDSNVPLNVVIPEISALSRRISFSLPSPNSAGSGWFQVEANPSSESLEVEPNDDPAGASPAQFPGALNGRLDKPLDRDHFKFHARKGQRVHCVGKTRELGSACDVHITLLKPNGSQIAVARQEAQAILDADVPEDGEYLLAVEDLQIDGPAGHVYRVDISEAYSGFSLAAEQTQYTAPHGGTFVIKVLAQRRGYDGPIDLHFEGLGDEVKLEGNKLEGPEGLLKVTLPATIPQGEMRLATIIGRAKVGDATISIKANQRASLINMFPNSPSLPSQLEETVAVGIGPPFPPFFDISIAQQEVIFPQLVGESSFDINITRSNDAFKEPLTIALEGLPPEIQSEIRPVEDGLKAARVLLKGPVDITEREVPIRIVGTGRFQDQTRTVSLQDITLLVTKPLVARVSMAGPIAAGGAQQAEVQLQRFGDDPQPVRIQVSNGPMGLSAPIFVTAPADVSQVKIPLMADAAAPAGRFDNLAVVATTTFKGQNITVESKPTAIEILQPTKQ